MPVSAGIDAGRDKSQPDRLRFDPNCGVQFRTCRDPHGGRLSVFVRWKVIQRRAVQPKCRYQGIAGFQRVCDRMHRRGDMLQILGIDLGVFVLRSRGRDGRKL